MRAVDSRLPFGVRIWAKHMSSSELAAMTQTDERYVREWLASQAAGGYVTYDEKTNQFSLSEEQAFALAKEDSPAYLPGAFELALGSLAAVPRFAESFRTAAGMGWHEHEEGVFHGCEKLLCTPCSRSLEVGLCRGAHAGEARICEVATAASFSHFRRAAETPFNICLRSTALTDRACLYDCPRVAKQRLWSGRPFGPLN